MSADDMDAILRVDEAATILRIKPATLRMWLQQERLRGFRLGNQWRVRRSDLDAFLKGEHDAR